MRTTIARRMAAILAATAILLSSVAPAGAWHNLMHTSTQYRWANGIVYYCFDNYPSTTHRNSAIAMADRLNGYLGNITLSNADVYRPLCQFNIRWDYAPGGLAAWSDIYLEGTQIVGGVIHINSWLTTWQYGAVQDCYVGVGQGCLPDMRTLVMHEMMHMIGLGHNRHPEEITRCARGFYSTGALSACDNYGEAVMFWEAGIEFANNELGSGRVHQGYRHDWPSSDDVLGLNTLY